MPVPLGVPGGVPPEQWRRWERLFNELPLDELVELRRLLVYVLVKRRIEAKRGEKS